MQFGITLKPDISVERIVGLTRQAEAAGFEFGWLFDSHVLWMDPYPLLTLMAANTQRMRLGTLVTNPAVRDLTVTSSLFATLNLISGGRMELGIGRGDSSRRVLGKKPVSWSQLETAVKIFRDLTASREIEYEGQPTRLTWAKDFSASLDSGLRAESVAHGGARGRWNHSAVCRSGFDFVVHGICERRSASGGANPKQIEVMSAAPVWVSDDLAVARERVRWFPALVSNHVMDLIRQYKPEDLPPALTSYVQDRDGYDYLHHCVVESDNANFVSDEVVDRFCLVGPVKRIRKSFAS